MENNNIKTIIDSIELVDRLKKDLIYREEVKDNTFNFVAASMIPSGPFCDKKIFIAKYKINGNEFKFEMEVEPHLSKEQEIKQLYNDIAINLSMEIIKNYLNNQNNGKQ